VVVNSNSTIERQIAQELTNTAIKNIREAGQFTLVDYTEVTRLEKAGETVANHVDVVFSGGITRLSIEDKTDSYKKDDKMVLLVMIPPSPLGICKAPTSWSPVRSAASAHCAAFPLLQPPLRQEKLCIRGSRRFNANHGR
jgi:hypothetical protein